MIFIIAKSADPWKLQVRYGVSRPRLPRRPAGEQAEVGRAPEEGVAQVEEAGEAEEACGGPLRCMLGLVMLGWGREFGVRDCGGGQVQHAVVELAKLLGVSGRGALSVFLLNAVHRREDGTEWVDAHARHRREGIGSFQKSRSENANQNAFVHLPGGSCGFCGPDGAACCRIYGRDM